MENSLLPKCAPLAAQLLQILQQGTEYLVPNAWPGAYQGNSSAARNARTRACEALKLQFDSNAEALQMKICRVIVALIYSSVKTLRLLD